VNTKLVNSAADVINAALTQNRTAAGIALALESAGLLTTPGTAAEPAPAEVFVPRTERSRWVDIAAALNAAHDAGMPLAVDLDGTLTDHRSWSVVWDRETARWAVAGYEDDNADVARDPIELRWGLNDVFWNDDDTVTVLLSDADGQPYHLELEPDRAVVLQVDLAGPGGLKAYRPSHDSIPMGLYLTAAAAREHCETEERYSWGTGDPVPSFDWVEDEEDGVTELFAKTGDGEEHMTGYVVTSLEISSAYDREADE
jgi:hypothetical protein